MSELRSDHSGAFDLLGGRNDFLADDTFAGVALGGMILFVTILTLGLVYEYKRGAMEWE